MLKGSQFFLEKIFIGNIRNTSQVISCVAWIFFLDEIGH